MSLQGAAGYVKIGNTITDPMNSGDSLENYWFTPVYFSQTWALRRLFYGASAEKNNLRQPA